LDRGVNTSLVNIEDPSYSGVAVAIPADQYDKVKALFDEAS
jgi:hypothetical protein